MQLKSLHIKKLFFQYSYDIDFKDTIKIITGPNGFGKTTILKMIMNLTCLNFYYFFQIPFEELEFIFENNFIIKIRKEPVFSDNNDDIGEEQEISNLDKFYISFNNGKEILLDQRSIDSKFDQLGYRKFRDDIWIEFIGEKLYLTSELLEKHSDIYDLYFQDNTGDLMKLSAQKVIFIQDYRLFSSVYEPILKGKNFVHIHNFEIDHCSKELRIYLSDIKSDFDKRFQEAQYIIISKINKTSNFEITDTEYTKRAIELNKILIRVSSFGICGKFQIPETVSTDNKNYLFITLIEYEKLVNSILDKIEQIELFVKLITESDFPNKRINVNVEYGFKFISLNGYFIANKYLSSGEQHRVITFYNLVFKTRNNMILLIDEPELSNHVIWQLSFLKDIKQVIKKKQIQTIIATHSPQIIDGKWELTSDLYKIRK